MPISHAGKNESTIFGIRDSDGQMNPFQEEIYVRQGKSLHMVVVSNYAWPLAWMPQTLQKFAGSCHYQ